MNKIRVLFICSKNRLRSPTAEAVFHKHALMDVTSAGLDEDAEVPLTPEMLDWAEVVFVMEADHLRRLHQNFGQYLKNRKVISLDIPDQYQYLDPGLVRILKHKVPLLLNLPFEPIEYSPEA